MYDDSYGYDHPTCSLIKCLYNCPDQCELLWRYNGFGYGNGYGRYSSLYV